MLERSDLTPRADLVALFPGQGSIAAGAGRPWRDSSPWGLVAEITEASGMDVAHLLLDAPDEDVIRTDHAQVATFALSMMGFAALLDAGVRPATHLGHSLGEFSALVAAGVLNLTDGSRLIAARGRAMADAARRHPGSMVALMGGDDEARHRLADLDDVWVANVNGTGQIVVSGTVEALEHLVENARTLGWRRATALPVGGAFHSPLMAPAQETLDAALDAARWTASPVTVIANVDARPHAAPEWRDLLSRQLTSPVEFLDATLALPDEIRTTIEMPPGAVLTGLTKRIRDFDQQVTLSSPEAVQEVLP